MRRVLALVMLSVGCAGAGANRAPIAVVQAEQAEDGSFVLDGRSSYDPDGDELEYEWELDHRPPDSAATLESLESGQARLQADVEGVFVVRLVVSDGELRSDPVHSVLTDGVSSDLPVAVAGPDRVVPIGQTASLDGGQSFDPLGTSMDFEWSLQSVPSDSQRIQADVQDARASTARFAADVVGAYVFSLVVRTEAGPSAPDVVVLSFEAVDNNAPTASATAPRRADLCTQVPVDCSASTDPDGDALVPIWLLQRAPEAFERRDGIFAEPNAMQTTAYLDALGRYSFTCSVFDGREWSRPDQVDVEIVPRATNAVPEVDLGPDRFVDLGTVRCTCPSKGAPWSSLCSCPSCVPPEVALTASIEDMDDDRHAHAWSVTGGHARIVGPADERQAVIYPASLRPAEPGLVFREDSVSVEVSDCSGADDADEVVIYTTCEAVYP